MGFLDEIKKLTRPYDDDDEDYPDEAEAATPPPKPQPQPERSKTNPFSNFSAESASSSRQASTGRSQTADRGRDSRVVNINGAAQAKVILIKPERFETAAEIADHLRSDRAVLMNMEATPREITRRLVDFLSGVTYAIDGNIRKVASNTYMLTPPNVDLVIDQLESMDAGGVYF